MLYNSFYNNYNLPLEHSNDKATDSNCSLLIPLLTTKLL